MKRAIVTGATGSIGLALVENLLQNGIEVLAIVRRGSPRNNILPIHPMLKTLECSLNELHLLQNENEEKFDVFYHLAWDGIAGRTRQDLYRQCENIRTTLDAVALANRFGCKTFIGAGSQAEYGRVEGVLRADTPAFPENGYGIAKLCAGSMAREYAHRLGMGIIWVRIVSVYGPNDSAENMIPSAIFTLASGKKMDFTKGEQLWDYLYNGDAAEAFFRLGELGKDNKIYVLGSGKARPLLEYIKILAAGLCAEGNVRIGAIPYGEKQIMHLCADISEITADTGWEPKTSFEEGIEKTIRFFLK